MAEVTVLDAYYLKSHVTMKDVYSNFFLPFKTYIPCWWCRESFDTSPIGAPIRQMKSDRCKKFLISNGYECEEGDYFETEGIFCSFECCKAYILCEKNGECSLLLDRLYSKLMNKSDNINIKPAPSWKLLEKWGGPLDYKKFKDGSSFYVLTNANRPFMFPVSSVADEFVFR